MSQWETGRDMPTSCYLDALCFLYRSRPDRLGFGNDYSEPESVLEPRIEEAVNRRHFLSSAAASSVLMSTPPSIAAPGGYEDIVPAHGRSMLAYVTLLEELVEESGYSLYTASPAEFVSARMVDLGRVEASLLTVTSSDLQRRLHRVFAKNAGFIAIRLNDVAGMEHTFEWFGIARRAARRADDPAVEAWVAGHICDACTCYGQSFNAGLAAAQMAQAAGGDAPNAAAVFGYLAEAGARARTGSRRAALDAIRKADRMFAALPDSETVADGLHITEYFLRWHQSNALTVIGEQATADILRARALELPFARQDEVGRALLRLDEAELRMGAGDLDAGCSAITSMWEALPAEFRVGQIPRRVLRIIDGVKPAHAQSREIRRLRDWLESSTSPESIRADRDSRFDRSALT
ncbi:hypothetical protein [Nocardia arizonensis]|uniref:hypothetical protein n=1 Tax=Nocardia arizonensis TaxID=1141647 RepID=UPI0012E27D34|nr:hypothetical protein [Nocardia arizonensis]